MTPKWDVLGFGVVTVDDLLYPENYLDGIGCDGDSTWVEITLG